MHNLHSEKNEDVTSAWLELKLRIFEKKMWSKLIGQKRKSGCRKISFEIIDKFTANRKIGKYAFDVR